eukprot:CAMPEP_0115015734 /NCGR_PEP_ID=MMETSP0216-20121206/26965_1 /TAXON_ID=223996 /ORGANISM="Protocruzia adherens, Strain Boccale" /LENGTH=112 /DNA_ID=CAMNT_0002385951 /DNA_START=30 /DNA_END=368 /DNA_ORIENTATION=-
MEANLNCICVYLQQNLQSLLDALQNIEQQQICDNSGCYESDLSLFNMNETEVTTSREEMPQNNAFWMIFGVMAVVYIILSFTSRRSRQAEPEDDIAAIKRQNQRDHSGHKHD